MFKNVNHMLGTATGWDPDRIAEGRCKTLPDSWVKIDAMPDEPRCYVDGRLVSLEALFLSEEIVATLNG